MDCNDLRKSSRNKRKRFSEDNTEICGICAEGWEEETEEIELWLGAVAGLLIMWWVDGSTQNALGLKI